MEKATKERLTGAAIVVAIVGIVVPELLSGPKGGTAAQSAATTEDAGPPLATYDLAMNPSAVPGVVRQQELASAVSAARSEEIAAAVPPPASAADTAGDAVTEDSQSGPVASAGPEPGSTSSPAKSAPATSASATPSTAKATPVTPQATSAAKPQVSSPAPTPATASVASSGSWWVQLASLSSAEGAQRLASDLRARGYTISVTRERAGGRDVHRVRAGPVKDRDAAQALKARLVAAGQKEAFVTQ